MTRHHMTFMVALGLGLAVGSCSRQASDDHTEICTKECNQIFECDPEPSYASHEDCMANCNNPDGFLWKYDDCEDSAEAMAICVAELSCNEYLAHQSDLENSPCHDVAYDFSMCLASNSH